MASNGDAEAQPSEPVAEWEAAEETRELRDVTIRVSETRPGFFEASLRPTSPETHMARNGYTLNTGQGLKGRSFGAVLDRAEAHWRQNYPSD